MSQGAQPPSIGRIVHYVLPDGEHRAATITNAFPGSSVANLTVHLDGLNDLEPGTLTVKAHRKPQSAHDPGNGTLAVGSAQHDEDTKAPGTWHWCEFVGG